ATAVMRTLNRHLTEGQVRKARDALPKGIRALWPEPEPAAKGATPAPHTERPVTGTQGPSHKASAEGPRSMVEHELERTGAATGPSSIAESAPGSGDEPKRPIHIDPATTKAPECAITSPGGSNRGGTKARRKRSGE